MTPVSKDCAQLRCEIVYSDQIGADKIAELTEFCRLAEMETTQPVVGNMATTFSRNRASLLYLLLEEKRFLSDRGGLLMGYDQNGDLVGVSGFYRSDFCPELFLVGVRSWIIKGHRFQLYLATEFIPRQLEAAEKLGAQAMAISFNEGNKAFHSLIERAQRSPGKRFFFHGKYPQLYHDIRCLPFQVNIKNTKQWVIYKYLHPNFSYDWEQIRWRD